MIESDVVGNWQVTALYYNEQTTNA